MTATAATGFLPDDRLSGQQALLLLGAAALVVAAHAGGIVWALQQPPADSPSEAQPAAVMIELAPEPVSPEANEQVLTPDTTDTEEVLEAEPQLPDLPEPAPLDLPPPTVEPEVVEARPIRRPEQPPKPEEKPKEKKPEKEPPSQATRKAAVEAPPADKAAASRTAAGGSGSVTPRAWQSRLVAHLERRKRYPSSARARKEEGVAQVFFRIDGSGNVLAVRLARSSGHPDLDDAAVSLVQRASPVPAPPPDAPHEITVPIAFNIR